MMRFFFAVFLLVGVQVSVGAPIADVDVDILNSSADGLQAQITFPADPGQRVPLGLMIVPEGASLSAHASLVGQESTGTPISMEIGDPAFIREVRIVTVALISPDAVERGTVLTIDVELNLSSVPVGPLFRGYLPPSFVEILRSSALNWDQVEVEERSPGLRYLVITPDALSGTVGPLFDWKERKGLGPELVTLNDIGSTDPYDIRLYIQDRYNTTGTLEYVLLIGDHELLPTFTGYFNPIIGGEIHADKYYAFLAGGDYLPDVHIGRLSVGSSGELAAMIEKVLAYERGDEADIWMHRATMASGNQHSSHKGTKRAIRSQLLGFGYDLVDTVFAPDQSAVDLIGAVTEGRSIVNYRGGLATRTDWTAIGFDVDDCNYLGNGTKRPLVFSLICLTGQFSWDGGDCLGEAWMKAAGGAIGFFGASQETHTFINNQLDFGLFDAIVNQGIRPMGAICDAGLYYMYYNYAWSDTVVVQLQQYSLLGDPETPLWVGEPGSMSVDHPASVPQATSDVVVNTGVDGALVCLRGAGVYETDYADASGNADFQITPTSSDQIDVTVTGYNMIPYVGQMSVAQTYTVAGNVYTEDGSALEGVTMTLTGDANDQATTNADGWYSFPNLNQGGYYTVTPSYSDGSGTWTFVPESMVYDNLQGDQWAQNYTANAPRYVLAGTVRTSWGAPFEGVAMDLSGYQSAQVLTNQNGWYQFDNVRGGQDYTITPSYHPQEGSWSFDPESRSYEFLDTNYWADDYSGAPPYYTISGVVNEEEGRGALEGVQIVLSGDAAETTYTASDGSYTLGPLAGGAYYAVTPLYSPPGGQWTFEPQDYQFQPLLGTETEADFEGSRPRYTLSGTILTRNAAGLEGVLVKLEGGKVDSVLTDQQGSYTLSDVPGGLAYTLEPALTFNDSIQWYFSPETVEIDTLMGNQDQIGFLGQLPVLCYLGDGEGEPGSTGNPILINFDNETYHSAAVDSLVLTILYSSAFGASVPDENAVEVIGRAEEFEVSYQVNETNPAACSLSVTLTGLEPLPAGTDSICRVLFSLDAGADTSRATELSFVSASAWDSAGVEIPVDSHDTGIFGSGVGTPPSVGPERFRLFPPSPNPSTGEVSFSFQIPRNAKATIVIRDLTGRIVSKLSPGQLHAGQHTVNWNGRSQRGKALPSGTYHCQLVACGETAHRLVVLVR